MSASMAWKWAEFIGSAEALKYARRDLTVVERVIGLCRGRTAAVQAGGNLGVFPKRLAQDFATVYTFEPAPDLFLAMMANAPELNIVKFQAALGKERGLIGLSRTRRDGKPNAHEGITHVSGSGVIPTLRVDDLGLSVCDLLYLDVEGWELYALKGAWETLSLCRPVVAVEINKNLGFLDIEPDCVRRALIDDHNYQFMGRFQSDEVFTPAEWGKS